MRHRTKLTLARAAAKLSLAQITPTARRGRFVATLLAVLFTTVTATAQVTISTADDWDTFASSVSNGTTYSGQTVTLANDITVSTMAGTSGHKFSGTFYGGGHTLTLNLTTDNSEFTAPFRYVDGATIKFLHTAGTVNGGNQKYATGLIGSTDGAVNITACRSSVAISSDRSSESNKDATHGGFIGVAGGTVTFTNCLFDGSITDAAATNCGGFVGWRNGTLTFNNCLMAGTMTLTSTSGSATFNRNSPSTLNNSYYKTAYGDVQGTQTSATGSDLQALLGSGWEVSGNNVVPITDANNLALATISGVDSYYKLTGSEIKPEPTVTAMDGTVLIKNTDYTVEWSGDGKTEGTYTVVVSGMGGYTGSQSASYLVSSLPAGMYRDTSKNPGDEGYYYVNMPTTNTFDTAPTIDLTSIYNSGYGATSIMVYDDGGVGGSGSNGAEGNYSKGCNGYLKLTAPAGCKLQFSGGVMINANGSDMGADALYIYDGNTNDNNKAFQCGVSSYRFFFGSEYNYNTYTREYWLFPGDTFTMPDGRVTSGEEMTLYFKSEANRSTYAGFYMLVEIIAPTPHNITTGTMTNGSFTASVAGVTVTEARQYDEVTLDFTPAAGYLLSSVTVNDGENDLPVSGGTWYDNAATFTMPDADVTVSATFTEIATAQAAGLSINMSSVWDSETSATIPSGVTSFSIYDAAGPNATTEDLDTRLTVTLKDDMAMRVTGSTSFTSGRCDIYDGNSKTIFDGDEPSNAISCETPGNVLVVSASTHNADVALNVEVISAYRELTVRETNAKDLLNFSFSGDGVINEGGTYKAKAGTTVTLTMTPKDDRYFYAYSVDACKQDDESVKYDVNWYGFLCPTATITMPLTAVHFWVKSFSDALTPETSTGLMIPRNGMAEVNVPSNLALDHFKVYDFAGREGDVSGAYGNFYDPDNGTLLLTAPEGKTFQLSNTSNIEAPKDKYLIIYNADNNETLTSLTTNTDEASHVYASETDLCKRIKIQFCSYDVNSGESPYKGVFLQLNIIDIPALTLNDASDNDLSDKTNKTYDVTLANRTLYKDGSWNTLCLPFSVSTTSGVLSGDGVKAMTLDTETSGLSGETLTLKFTEQTTIPAGTPFIIKWDGDGTSNIVNPVFSGVTIDDDINNATVEDVVTFTGTYAPVSIGSSGDNTKLYLGEGNKLYWPNATMTIGAQRAYFQLLGGLTAGEPASSGTGEGGGKFVRAFVLNFGEGDASAIVSLSTDSKDLKDGGAWYSLDGRRLSGKPTRSGMYINNDKKIVIK